MAQGTFIAFEGIDGCGKSTQVEAFLAWARARGHDPLLVREPGGTALGERVRELLLRPDTGDIDPAAEALLYAASRAELVSTVLRPALDAGRLVVADRFVDSSLAYQGAGRDLGVDTVRAANALATGGLLPDVTVLLRIDPEAAARRRARAVEHALPGAIGIELSEDRIESAGMAFFARVATAYVELAAAEPQRFLVIDAAGSEQEVTAAIIAGLDAMIPAVPSGVRA